MGRRDRDRTPAPPATAADITEKPTAPAALPELNLPVVATLDGREVRGRGFLHGMLLLIDGRPVYIPHEKIGSLCK